MARYLIIAASSGMGTATVEKLRTAGHEVITTARDGTKSAADFSLDATDFDAVEDVFRKVGRLDGVAGFPGLLLLKAAHMTSREQYQAVIDASLTTSFAIVRAAGKHMSEGGSVVLVSSAAALAGFANHEAIAAAKAGVVGLTLSAAATYASVNLRFNAIAPGLVETGMTNFITASEPARKASQGMHALGRLGKVSDIASAVQFLLDGENDWITGQVLAVDGGLSSIRPRAKA